MSSVVQNAVMQYIVVQYIVSQNVSSTIARIPEECKEQMT
jgi:hypothetical protein